MPFELAPGRSVDLTAQRLELSADTRDLRLAGDATVDGAPVAIDWRESYGAGQGGRVLTLSGEATPELLAAAGASDLPIEGAPSFELTLQQSGGGPLDFTLDADLAPAQLRDRGARTGARPQGVPARLHAEGNAARTGSTSTALHLDSPALDVEGSLRLEADGALEQAEFSRSAWRVSAASRRRAARRPTACWRCG